MPQNRHNSAGQHQPVRPRTEDGRAAQGREEAQGQSLRNAAGSSFAARFGRTILKHGVAAIPSALYHFQGRLGLTAQQVWFVSYILSHKWDEDLPYPSIAQMARCTGVSDRMLRYRCNELHHLSYLQIYPRYHENGGQGTNYFDFSRLFARLEEIISQEAPRPNPIQQGENGALPLQVVQAGQADSSFLARYGRVILGYGIASVPRALFTHQKTLDLTPQQVWFTCYILSFQWDIALPYPSINRMAERTGYSKQQLHTLKGELVAKGYLYVERRLAEGGGNDTNLYDFSPLLDAIRSQLEPGAAAPEEMQESNPEEQATGSGIEGQTEGEETLEENKAVSVRRRHRPSQPKYARGARDNSQGDGYRGDQILDDMRDVGAATELTRGAASGFTTPSATGLSTRAANGLTSGVATQLSGQGKQAAGRPLNQGLPEGRKQSLPEVEALNKETFNRDDSNHQPQKNKSDNGGKGQLPAQQHAQPSRPYSPYISSVVADFSDDLGDTEHIVSNVSRTLRLWAESGLDEKAFVDLMYTAKKRTRAGQGMHGSAGLSNKMAYYFTVLRQLVDGLSR
ncbi:MAG: hypothetical protein ABI670_22470 [Chloroflexota bacterium]